MKFTWFNLMPWPYLPDDFRDTHRSVWVDIPSRLYDPAKGHHVYHQHMDQLEHADALGFDGIGVNEHHQNGYGQHLFQDASRGVALLTAGVRADDPDSVRQFYIAHSRRLAMAGKILFPIPNRGVARRLYRLRARTLVLWGAADRLIPPVYATRWGALIPGARVELVAGAGHMLPYEQPEAFARIVAAFVG